MLERRKIIDTSYNLVVGFVIIPFIDMGRFCGGGKVSSSDLVTLGLCMKHLSVNI